MDYYSFTGPKGWNAELAWLVDPLRTLYPRSGHSQVVNHRSGEDQGKSDSRTTQPRANNSAWIRKWQGCQQGLLAHPALVLVR